MALPAALDAYREDLTYLVAFSFFFATFYVVIRFTFPHTCAEEKRRAWTISALNSFLTILSGARSLYLCYAQHGALVNEEFYTTGDFISSLTCHMFRAFCVVETIIGLIDFPTQLNLGTTYCHHILYFILQTIILSKGMAHGMCVFFVEEVPTHILAMGTLNPALRADYSFGITFAILRLAFHAYLLAMYLTWRPNPILGDMYPWIVASMLAHLFWFYSWISGMIRRAKKAKHPSAKDPAAKPSPRSSEDQAPTGSSPLSKAKAKPVSAKKD